MENVEHTYDAKFEGNILIVGQTGCGKITFIHNLAESDLLVTLKKFSGYQKYSFNRREKKTSRAVLKNM